jgi:hypothetical protein
MVSSVMIVDPDRQRADALALQARKYRTQVATRGVFEEALKEILQRAPLLLLTHTLVGTSQGVHLAQAAIRTNSNAHAVLYGGLPDLVLARKMFSTKVFFERLAFVRHSLPRYLTADLPGLDRRNVRVADRRTTFRGGRRASDVEALWAQARRH